MEIRKCLNEKYIFVNSYGDTRNGFCHKTTLFCNNWEIGTAKCNYLNRTWEFYRYQTVMQRCVSNIIDNKQKEFIEKCKKEKGIKRLVKKEKDLILQHFEQLQMIKELRQIYKELQKSA